MGRRPKHEEGHRNITFTAPEHVYKLVEIYKKDHNFSEMVCNAIIPILIKNTNSDGINTRLSYLNDQKKELEEKQKQELGKITGEISRLEDKLKMSKQMEADRFLFRRQMLERAVASPDWFTPEGRKYFLGWAESNTDLVASAGFESADHAYDFLASSVTSQVRVQSTVSEAAEARASARKQILGLFKRNSWLKNEQAFSEWTESDRGKTMLATADWTPEKATEQAQKSKSKEEARSGDKL